MMMTKLHVWSYASSGVHDVSSTRVIAQSKHQRIDVHPLSALALCITVVVPDNDMQGSWITRSLYLKSKCPQQYAQAHRHEEHYLVSPERTSCMHNHMSVYVSTDAPLLY